MESRAFVPVIFKGHIKALDGIRGLAILYVILHHSQAISWSRGSAVGKVYSAFVQAGWMGVDLFFVMSGFLITGILLKTRGTSGWLRNFLVRRALRVLPLYYVTIFVCLDLLPLVSLPSLDWLRNLSESQLYYWLHLSNFRRIAAVVDPSIATVGWMSTFWSLAIEEHFYLFWPLAVMFLPRRFIGVAALLGVAFSLLMRISWAIYGVDGQIIYYHTLTRLDGLFLGSAVASFLFSGADLLRFKKPAVCMLYLCLLSFIIPAVMGYPVGGRDSTFFGKTFLYSSAVFLSASLLVLALDQKTVVSRFFSWQPLRVVGKYSYAMYVFNKPILGLVAWAVAAFSVKVQIKTSLGMAFLGYLVATLLTLGAAWISWQLLEKRFLALKKYFELPSSKTATDANTPDAKLQSMTFEPFK
jgi:peptidoglycan/LPS O-acetylase OafA/YrhL